MDYPVFKTLDSGKIFYFKTDACYVAQPSSELSYVSQAGLKLTEVLLHQLPSAGT